MDTNFIDLMRNENKLSLNNDLIQNEIDAYIFLDRSV